MENTLKHPKLENLQVKSTNTKPIPINKKLQLQQQLVWDCGSTLYDSFELNSFKRQLDSAIVSRTLSMPHLPDRRAPPPAAYEPAPPVAKKSSSRFSRSLQKLLKTVFKSRHGSSTWLKLRDRSNDEYFFYYDKTGALTTIPEGPEIDFGGLSPEINSLARRTASDRCTAPTVAISCA